MLGKLEQASNSCRQSVLGGEGVAGGDIRASSSTSPTPTSLTPAAVATTAPIAPFLQMQMLRLSHRRASLSIERTQEGFRAREMLKVQSTESYHTDSRIRLGAGAYRRQLPFPFFASPLDTQEGSNQRHDQSTY